VSDHSPIPSGGAPHLGGLRALVQAFTSARWYPLALYLGLAAVMYLLVVVAVEPIARLYAFGDNQYPFRPREEYYTGPTWLAGWARWDAGWYRSITDNGYFFRGKVEQSSVAFFPLYPLLMRWLRDAFGGDASAWGVLITFLSGFGAAMLYWRWLGARVAVGARATAFAVFALWPYAFYLYGAVYADALFVVLVLAAFTCVEERKVALAALFGALATATRPVGIAVVLGLTARVLEQRGVVRLAVLDRIRWLGPRGARAGAPSDLQDPAVDAGRLLVVEPRRLRMTDPLVLFAASGLLAYMVYLWREFDDPVAFATAEAAPGWAQEPGPRVWFKAAWFSRLVNLPDSGMRYFAVVTFQAVLVIALVFLVPRICKRFGWAYAGYTLVLLAFPLLGSKDFQGLGRYALGAFPAFAMVGELLAERPRLRRLWFIGATASLVVLGSSYARGGYVA
jgi:hypothetical protein